MAKKSGFDAWVIVEAIAAALWKAFLLVCRVFARFGKATAHEAAISLSDKRKQLIARKRYGIGEKIIVGTLLIICEEIAR